MTSHTKTAKRTWGILIIMIGVAGLIIWQLFFQHVTEPDGPVSKDKAESFLGIALPAEATNIRIAGYYHGPQYEQFLRYQAPTSTCLAHMKVLSASSTTQSADLIELQMAAKPIRPSIFRDISWFDLQSAKNVCTTGGGPGVAQIWVDQNRGVFYYKKTD